MKISLVGMSGSGKSYWSKKLQEEKGFKRFCCDDIIEQKLNCELKKIGYSGIQDVAKWMGQPFDPQYKIRSKKYIFFEKKAMDEILNAVENCNSSNKDIIIDTTGSVIYTGDNVLQKLSKLTQVIYLDTPASVQREMYQLYLKDPKPVIWGKSFHQVKGESNIDALQKSYPKLLIFRSKKYEKIMDNKLDYHVLRSPDINADYFIKSIKND